MIGEANTKAFNYGMWQEELMISSKEPKRFKPCLLHLYNNKGN